MPASKGNKFAVGNPGGGGPAKYDDRFVEMVFTISLLGATDKQLADCFGVSEQTIDLNVRFSINARRLHFS